MTLSKNTLTRSLMFGSIALVLILQVFWLKSSYEDASDSFRQEAGFLFRSTVMNMQDSLIRENIEQVPGDSLFFHVSEPSEDMKMRWPLPDVTYSKSIRPGMPDSGNMAIIISTGEAGDFADSGDSLSFRDEPALFKVRKERFARYYILRQADSLRAGDIENEYASVLDEAGIRIPFNVISIPIDTSLFLKREFPFPPAISGMLAIGTGTNYLRGPGPREEAVRTSAPAFTRMGSPRGSHRLEGLLAPYTGEKNTLTVDHVFLPHTGTVLAVQFGSSDYRWLLVREIAPQLLFSLVMILFISISFYFMYRSLRMQQRLVLLKNDFVSNVTHELKTPVATASVAIEALRNFHILDNPVRTREYLEIAQQELSRLTLLTDNILKAAIFENNGIHILEEKLDLKAVTAEVLSSMKLVFESKNANVAFRAEGEDFMMEGGKAHIVNMIYNLLDNALKYSPSDPVIDILLKDKDKREQAGQAGEATTRSRNRALRQSGGLQFVIRDKGIGIDAEFHKKIFEKFFRVPSGDVHNTKGHGLGLNYVASVVKSHGGTIRLESDPGKGSSFTIYLPRRYEKN